MNTLLKKKIKQRVCIFSYLKTFLKFSTTENSDPRKLQFTINMHFLRKKMHIYSKMQFQRIHRTSERHQWAFQGFRAIKDPELQNFMAFPKEALTYFLCILS